MKKEATVDKLIIAGIENNLTYDSIGKPQLILCNYLEFSNGNEIKYAQGDSKYLFQKKAPSYCLDRFYHLGSSCFIKQLIDKTLTNKSFDSLYINKGEGVFYVLIYKVSDTIRHIVYKPRYLPKSLYSLDSTLRTLTDSSKLVKAKPFPVDRLLPEFEKYLFKIHPPPPPPMVIDSI
jgi:hypothetical protein